MDRSALQSGGGGSKGLSARQLQLLALEGSAYSLRWVGGEPIVIQDPALPRKLTPGEEHFIAQHARDAKAAAAAVPEKPKAQASSRGPAGSKQAPASRGDSLQSRHWLVMLNGASAVMHICSCLHAGCCIVTSVQHEPAVGMQLAAKAPAWCSRYHRASIPPSCM